jgi:hypothetical protein
MPYESDDWTPGEREALERLPKEEDPGRLMEERTVAALRERGLLSPATDRAGGAGRRATPAPPHPAWWAAAVAAGLALFFAGLAVGGARSTAAAHDLVLALREADAAERPTLIQETGSLYVDAVASLAQARASGDEAAVGTGIEVAVAALYAAAYELARLHPDDARLRQVLEALDPAAEADPAGVHWF